MIMKAGWNTVMSCSDMCDAYNMTLYACSRDN